MTIPCNTTSWIIQCYKLLKMHLFTVSFLQTWNDAQLLPTNMIISRATYSTIAPLYYLKYLSNLSKELSLYTIIVCIHRKCTIIVCINIIIRTICCQWLYSYCQHLFNWLYLHIWLIVWIIWLSTLCIIMYSKYDGVYRIVHKIQVTHARTHTDTHTHTHAQQYKI